MTDEIEIIPAVAGQKNKASTYNENFNRMKNYVITSVETLEAETRSTLSLYQTVNTLATSGTIALTDNSVNSITPAGAVTFTLPTITGGDAGKFHQILVQVNIGSGATSYLSADDERLGTENYFNNIEPVFNAVGIYDIIYEYDNVSGEWCCGSLYKGTVS